MSYGKERNLKNQWREWTPVLALFWLSAMVDILVTFLYHNPAQEANPLVAFLCNHGFLFLHSLLLVLIPFTLLQTGLILALWKTKYDVLSFTFAIGLGVGHFIGAASWFRSPWLLLAVPTFSCVFIGLVLDILGVKIEVAQK